MQLKTQYCFHLGHSQRTPIIFAKTSGHKLSTIGGITTSGQFLQETHPGALKGLQVIAFLSHVLRHVPGSVTVMLDNASGHKTKALVAAHECLSVG